MRVFVHPFLSHLGPYPQSRDGDVPRAARILKLWSRWQVEPSLRAIQYSFECSLPTDAACSSLLVIVVKCWLLLMILTLVADCRLLQMIFTFGG